VTSTKVNSENFLREVRKMLPRGQRPGATSYKLRGKFSTLIENASHYSFCYTSKPKQNI